MSIHKFDLVDSATTDEELGKALGFTPEVTAEGKTIYRDSTGEIVGRRESPERFVLENIWRHHLIGSSIHDRVQANPVYDQSTQQQRT